MEDLGESIEKGIKTVVTTAIKHPVGTLALLGTTGTAIAMMPLATRYLTGPVYLATESKKKNIMNQQTSLLSQMLAEQRRPQMITKSQATETPPLS